MKPSAALIWTLFTTQWRMWLNFYRRHGQITLALSMGLSALWLAGFAGLALFVGRVLADPANASLIRRYLAGGLFAACAYWQFMPLMMASIGGLLDLKKLRAYPVPDGQLFTLEIILRAAMFPEMPLVMLGVAAGLARNPAMPRGAWLAPLLFTIFNIAFGAAIRDLIVRLFAHKRVRELGLLVFVLLIASPSVLLSRDPAREAPFWKRVAAEIPTGGLPWVATARASTGEGASGPWIVLIASAAIAWGWARWQFSRNLRFDAESSPSVRRGGASFRPSLLDRVFSWPSAVFPDPLGVLVEKEIRFLSRVSRFRVVFLMGFTFGLLIWLPVAGGRAGSGGWMAGNFLSVISVYALVLLSEVCFYNAFGFDRSAAQLYFAVPLSPRLVLVAKNIAAVFFVAAEVTLVMAACALLRMPLSASLIAEAAAVCSLMTLFLLGVGNLGSTRSPRAQNPNDGWRRTAGSKFALVALAVYPLISLPIALAYLARWAFREGWAFYGVIGLGLFVAGCFYWISLDAAERTLQEDRENFLHLLAQGDAPVI